MKISPFSSSGLWRKRTKYHLERKANIHARSALPYEGGDHGPAFPIIGRSTHTFAQADLCRRRRGSLSQALPAPLAGDERQAGLSALDRRCSGGPWIAKSSVKQCRTSSDFSLRAVTMARHWRVNSSMTVSIRKERPSCVRSPAFAGAGSGRNRKTRHGRSAPVEDGCMTRHSARAGRV